MDAKKIAASACLLVVFVLLAAFVGFAGGAKWGTHPMGALMGTAIMVWLVAQPLVWMEK
jgi:hypothetical protein